MSINLNEITEEYARLPFEPQGIYFFEKPVGHIQEGYNTNLSAFLFPLRGKARFNLSENSYDFQPGNVIHGCPGKWLTAQNEGEIPVAFFTLYYHYDGATTGYMHSPYEMEIGMNPRLFSMLRQLVELRDKPKAQPTLQVKTLVYSVLSEMFSSAQSIRQTNANSIVEDAKAYVERHYMEQHSLCELGGRYGMCGKYFSDVFKKYAGISPIDYLIAFRMRQARNLLEQTECNIKEIGKSVGYQDAKSFSRQFRKNFGISPNGLREQILSDQIRKSAP